MLQWSAGVEVTHRQIDSIGFQLSQKIPPDPCGPKTAVDIAGLVGMLLDEAINVLRQNFLALHSGNFSDAENFALSIRQALQLQNDGYGRCDLAANAADSRRHTGHGDHLLKSLERIA